MMSNTEAKIKESIGDAASGAKHTTEKAVDKSKEVSKEAGRKVEDAGEKIKNMGK
jgi:hypothetical protein